MERVNFQEFGLSEAVLRGIEAKGYSEATPIQAQAIPLVLQGRDVMGSAQTGTGKTAAFALPMLTQLGEAGGAKGHLRALVLEPTRELAQQVHQSFVDYGKFTGLNPVLIHGGVGYGSQREGLQKGADVVIATPGRLLDFMEDGTIKLGQVRHLVLDEVDRMLDMGFLPDVTRIIKQCPKDRQTLFFSATLPPELETLTKWILRDPISVEIGRRQSAAETVAHALYPVAKDQKIELLFALLEAEEYHSVIIFTQTKVAADIVGARLKKIIPDKIAIIHGDRNQGERTESLAGFKSGKYEVLVATDIAARGLDIAGVTHVINYDVPQHPEDYVHRIGRTGRALQTGDAFTIFTAEELDAVRKIERYIGAKIPREKLEGFNYLYTALFNEGNIRPGGVGKGVRTLKGFSIGRR
jgi:ATP-dependent RNA helicase RhlE